MENEGEGDTKVTAIFVVCPNGWTMVAFAEKRRLKKTKVEWKITNLSLNMLLLKYRRAKSKKAIKCGDLGFRGKV